MAVIAASVPTIARRRRGKHLLGEITLLAAAFAVMLVLVYPTAWIFIASFRTPETMFAVGGGVFTLANYTHLLGSGFARAIFNSLFLCATSVVLSTIVAVSAAYVFSRLRFWGKRPLFAAVMLGQTFPWIILVTPLFILFAQLGLLDNYLGMIFVYVSVSIPFSIYLLVGYLEAVPRSLDEAAILDGCSQFQVLWRIVFPIMLPGVVATATYAFLLCWTEYLFALAFLTQTEMKTLPLGLYQFFGDDYVDWGAVMAASVVTTLPVFLLFLPIQGWISPGRIAGAVK
jgi:ABC-type glycerol-3-phosphate transport system permease component